MGSPLHYDPLSKEFELIMVDALALFVQAKISDSDQRLDRFLLDYFRKVKLGEHVFCRSYEFITGSDHNKKMFVSLFWKTYHHLAFAAEALSEADYYNLLLFLCPDIPKSLVAAAFMTLSLLAEGRLYFSEFIYSFQLCFYFPNFIKSFRDTLNFKDAMAGKEEIIALAADIHKSISKLPQNPENSLPPLSLVQSAFTDVETFESWKKVQECLARSDGINNYLGILPMRSTMADHDSLKSLIPSEWNRKHPIQPTVLTLNSSSNAPDSGPTERATVKAGASNLSTSNKLLRRPSRQNKLGSQLSQTREQDADGSEHGSNAENASTVGGGSNSRKISIRKHPRGKLPSIASAASIANDHNGNNRIHMSSSVPTNLSSQVIDEQSSSDDASSLSSDADN